MSYDDVCWRGSCASRGLSGWWVVSLEARWGHRAYIKHAAEIAYAENQEPLVKRWAEGWVRHHSRRIEVVRPGSLKWVYVEVPY